MKQMKWVLRTAAVVALIAGAAPVRAGDHAHLDIEVGVNSLGQLMVEFDDDEPYLLPAVDGPIFGWASDDPGFASLEEDEPDEDLFVLDMDANIEVEFISADDAFTMWIPPFFSEILDTPGERWDLGGSEFDTHPEWHIDSNDPDFDPMQTEWEITLKLVDTRVGLGTPYADSNPFTLRFAPVPEPATMALMAVGGAVALARRRRVC